MLVGEWVRGEPLRRQLLKSGVAVDTYLSGSPLTVREAHSPRYNLLLYNRERS
jgi:hypothetical protein